jgi:hypothetical protein
MLRLLIPLYYRPVNLEIGVPSSVTLDPMPHEDTVLITRETFAGLREELSGHGTPRFHLFDTEAEARAAYLALSHEQGLNGAARTAEVGRLRDGEGVLMLTNENLPIRDDGFTLIDNRNGFCRKHIVFGSWEFTDQECAEVMGAEPGLHRYDLATAIAMKMNTLPGELIRDVQIAMERLPGAYAVFVAACAEDIRRDHRLEGVDPSRLTDELIQPFLGRAVAKAELGGALNEAVDAAVERLLEAHPDLAHTDAPEI